MSKLEEFLKSNCPAANRANPANPATSISKISEISNGAVATSDPWAEHVEAFRLGILHQCCLCQHFSLRLPPDADDGGLLDAGWCRRYGTASHPKVPFVCDGYADRTRAVQRR